MDTSASLFSDSNSDHPVSTEIGSFELLTVKTEMNNDGDTHEFDSISGNVESQEWSSAISGNSWEIDVSGAAVARTKNESQDHSAKPDLSKCLPNWKEIFPWMSCKSDNTLFCVLCSYIKHKGLIDVQREIITVTSKRDMFLVASSLRTHSETLSHSMATFLAFRNVYKILMDLWFNSFNCRNTDYLVSLTKQFISMPMEMHREFMLSIITITGTALGDLLVAKLRRSIYFSMVSDPCRRYLYIRCIDDGDVVRDFALVGFLYEDKLSPEEYISSLGFDMNSLVVDIHGKSCGKCDLCRKHPVTKQQFDAPKPSLYVLCHKELESTEILKPVFMSFKALASIFKKYKQYFLYIPQHEKLLGIKNCLRCRDTLKYLVANFETFQSKAAEIYEDTLDVEALGFSTAVVPLQLVNSNVLTHLPEFDILLSDSNYSVSIKIENLLIAKTKIEKLLTSINCGIVDHISCTSSACKSDSCEIKRQLKEPLWCIKNYIDESLNPIYFDCTIRSSHFSLLFKLNVLLDVLTGSESSSSIDTILECVNKYLKCGKEKLIDELKAFIKYAHQNNFIFSSIDSPLKLLKSSPPSLKLYPSNVYELYRIAAVFPWMHSVTSLSLYDIHIAALRVKNNFEASVHSPMLNGILNSFLLPLSVNTIFEWYKIKLGTL